MNRIRELRKQKKLTQKELAKHLKIANSTLSYWETGKYEPDIESLRLLSRFFQVSIDYIIGGDTPNWQMHETVNVSYAEPDNLHHTQTDMAVKEAETEYETEGKYIAFNRSEFDNLTQEDIDKLAEYAEFIKSKKKKPSKSHE